MTDVKTVKIKGGQDEPPCIIINEEDFDAKTMKLFVESELIEMNEEVEVDEFGEPIKPKSQVEVKSKTKK